MIFNTSKEEIIIDNLSRLQPLKYNKFYWWRRWGSKNKPLPITSSLYERICNGDLDFSHYFWQAQYCEVEINNKYSQYPDYLDFLDKTQLDRARRKNLWDDFEKDENEKLKILEEGFQKEFNISKEDYYKEISEFGGDLKEFYIHCDKKYGKSIKTERRGRPKKIKN